MLRMGVRRREMIGSQMRNVLFTVGALLALVAPVCGGVARTGVPGKIILENTGIEIRPRIFLPGWMGVGAEGGVSKGGALSFGFRLGASKASGRASFVATGDGGISARWFVTSDGEKRMEQIYLGTSDIPDDIRIGGSYVVDGVEKPFPAAGTNFHFGWKKDARVLVLKDRDG